MRKKKKVMRMVSDTSETTLSTQHLELQGSQKTKGKGMRKYLRRL